MAVLEDEHERLLGRPRAEAVGEQRLERGLADLGVERPRQLVVRDRDREHGLEQRRARNERRIDGRELALERRSLLVLRAILADAEQRSPDLLPDAVGRLRAEGRRLAERDEDAVLAAPAHELGDQARLADARVGRDPDDGSLALLRPLERGVERGELLVPPDDRELVANLPRARVPRPARERERGDRLLLALDRHVVQSAPT